jgi:malate synthase
VPVAKAVFDKLMPEANQIARQRQDVNVAADDLLQVPTGPITEAGLRMNVNIGLGYIEAWLRGTGCVPLHNLMEDAATAEISRAQVWQWLKHGAKLVDGQTVDRALVDRIIGEERDRAAAKAASHRFDDAAALFGRLVTAGDFVEFLTLPAYEIVD